MNLENKIVSPTDFVSGCRAVLRPGQYAIVPQENWCPGSLHYLKDADLQFLTSPKLGADFLHCSLLPRVLCRLRVE